MTKRPADTREDPLPKRVCVEAPPLAPLTRGDVDPVGMVLRSYHVNGSVTERVAVNPRMASRVYKGAVVTQRGCLINPNGEPETMPVAWMGYVTKARKRSADIMITHVGPHEQYHRVGHATTERCFFLGIIKDKTRADYLEAVALAEAACKKK